ncbi:BamA/OMP85 family outer membrane protein [Formosa algae]|uniref:BamA/OMP85 family outer membrane protein n=1 Tax=Formosa algae TaxID=225843 RepID=UPI000CD117B5|nr:POTRA domain-containing protein [Formosa algae]
MMLLLIIKKENAVLEKQVNNLANLLSLKTYLPFIFILFFSLTSNLVSAQASANGKKYTISDITVSGNSSFSEQTIVTYSGLRKGSQILIPGEEISESIKKLWKSGLFSDIEIYIKDIEGDTASLEIHLFDLPELTNLRITGVKKGKMDDIIEENNLNEGVKITENLITTTKNYLESKYRKDGYFNSKVIVRTYPIEDSIAKPRVNMIVAIEKGEKVKVKDINFEGNTVLADKKLLASMKNTKKKMILRAWKRSKFIEDDYKTDLVSIIDTYKENGYRDARIISDSVYANDNKTVSIDIKVEEGSKYTFGEINFLGNSVYTDEYLSAVLRVRKGDTYNGVLLEKGIADESRPDGNDITNLYQNNGYLFSTINPVETNADGNVIDMEIRISEGKPVHFNEVTVVGNEKTNDHVIYREIRTRPGELYSKENVVRTVRELSQLGFFDAEQITPNFNNPNPNEGTIDMEYEVVETGSSQIELQGGYGGGGFIGTLGLSFNNFSLKNIFNKEAYKPLPMGDGQQLSLRLQASQFYRTYSFSFSEPWMGGVKPVQFSTSLSYSNQFLYDSSTGEADKDRRFDIIGITVGLAKRLSIPDDFFTLSQSVSLQHYNLKNYSTGLFTFSDGYSNSLAYTIGLTRNNTWNDPVFPLGGSNFSVSAKLSLPYSLVNGVDYADLAEERQEQEDIYNDTEESSVTRTDAYERMGEIDQERFNWLEFYKIKFKGEWYTNIIGKLVLKPTVEFGYLGAYNQDRGVIPFERFYLGGDGLGSYSLDGREAVALRGYANQSIQPVDSNGNTTEDGASIYNKFSLELRYPITLKASAKIYALSFIEGGAAYNAFSDYNPFQLKRSAGVGLRVFMPAFGLLGIDFGYGFDPLPGEINANGWETHFIIGQQF